MGSTDFARLCSHKSFFSLFKCILNVKKVHQCAEYVKLAVAADQDGNFPVAFENYKIALDYFSTHLKYEKNPRAKETITQKVHCFCDKHTFITKDHKLTFL